ncbi:hypothetical protein DL98DRAFT_600540 [Cadophora sp. DSE1049]|nr:hypothetical protein DL98DRAFT_600540 [Cadophora sp. DSE1049]
MSRIRPRQAGKELLNCQAAPAISAAPPYFTPFNGYQAGGLRGYNNPIHMALWEQDTIRSRDQKQADCRVPWDRIKQPSGNNEPRDNRISGSCA